MKFAVLSYKKSVRPNSKNWNNIGDTIQSYATINLYKHMGIKEDDLVKIDRYQARSYDGDYVILPYNCYNIILNQYKHKFNSLPVSNKIIPVFISFHLHSKDIDEDIINQLKEYQPIGCRDEETMLNLREHGVTSYLSGCVTATLPRRTNIPKKTKVFLVDIPDSLKKYLQEKIINNCEYCTHIPEFKRTSDDIYLTDEEAKMYYLNGVKQLERYKNEATLVVTSRLHAASPCMAMGIPVILVSENFDGRFSWIDKYLHLYTPDEFHTINWNPQPVNYEDDKKLLINMFTSRIQKAYDDNNLIYDCSNFYESRDKFSYNHGLIYSLKKIESSIGDNVKYALWGLRADTLNILNVIKDNFSSWKLAALIDQNSEGLFEGIKVKKADCIDDLDKDVVFFIVPEAAHEFASNYLKERNRKYVIVNKKRELTLYK